MPEKPQETHVQTMLFQRRETNNKNHHRKLQQDEQYIVLVVSYVLSRGWVTKINERVKEAEKR